MEAGTLLQFEKVPKVRNRRQKWKRAHFCNSKKCQKCITVVKNGSGHIFAIRKRAKSLQLSSTIGAGTSLRFKKKQKCIAVTKNHSGHVFANTLQTHSCTRCINLGWVRRLSLLWILCARRHQKRTHQAELVGEIKN